MSDFDKTLLKRIIEGLLLASQDPLTVKHIQEIIADPEAPLVGEAPDLDEILAALEDIQADCREHGYELKEVASGWRYQVGEDLAQWVGRLWEEKPVRYSRAILETLALVAYRQPITRGDIEDIRGVAVSTGIIKTLLERQWVRVVGHRDVPGRPALYATTRQFLDYFNLKSLEELPMLSDIRDIDKLNAELDFERDQQVAAVLGAESDVSIEVDISTETDVSTETEVSTPIDVTPDEADSAAAVDATTLH